MLVTFSEELPFPRKRIVLDILPPPFLLLIVIPVYNQVRSGVIGFYGVTALMTVISLVVFQVSVFQTQSNVEQCKVSQTSITITTKIKSTLTTDFSCGTYSFSYSGVGAGQSTTCIAFPSGGTSPYTYQWTVGGIGTIVGTNWGSSATVKHDISKGNSGTIPVTLRVTDAAGNTATKTRTISVTYTGGVTTTTTTTTVPTSTCSDSDGGLNIFSKGTLTFGTFTSTDYCPSSTQVYEYRCLGSYGTEKRLMNCPSGYSCQDGACVQGTSSSDHRLHNISF